MTRKFTLAVAAIVLGLAALFAACSDDDDQAQQQVAQASQQQEEQQAAQPTQAQQQQAAAQPADDAEEIEPLQIVASTQVVADWVRQVGGDRVEVRALVPAGADAHTIELTVDDIRAIAAADLVVINGAGLESAYEDVISENANRVLNLAEALEERGYELAPFSGMMEGGHDDHDDHGHEDEDEHDHEQEEHEDHAAEAVGRLIIADALEAHLSVVDLSTEEVDEGAFSVAAVNSTVYPSPTHRFAFILARGPEDDDDRIHVFDGGVFLVAHDDHYDLIAQPASRTAVEIAVERPIHFVNNAGWTAVFADGPGWAILFDEHEMIEGTGDYEPVVLSAGLQHGAAAVISDEHVMVTTNNPDYPDEADSSLPIGVEVWDFEGNVVYDASNRSCPGMHGEIHIEHGFVLGCVGGVLFLHAHDGEYEHEWIANPPEMQEASRIGSFFAYHEHDHVFGRASYFDGQGFASDGLWLIDIGLGEWERVFDVGILTGAFDGHGETLFILGDDGVLYALDGHDGDVVDSTELFGRSETGSPRMIAVGENLFITNPADGHVVMVDGESLEVVEEWHVGGAPSSLAFVGVQDADGAPHAGHDEEMHEDEDEHEHEEDEHEQHDEEEHEQDEHGHAHDHGDEDPHYWFDTDAASLAVEAIADALATLAPESAGVFEDRVALYLDVIADADAEVRSLLADIPDEHRLLVTFHDAFAYFASRYGLTVVGFLIEGPEQGVGAESVVELIEVIEHEGVQTVFREPQFDSTILEAVADETGVSVGIIWSQPTDEQPTYIDILLANARAIAEQ